MHKKTTLLIASLGLAFTHANAFTSYTGGLLSENFDALGTGDNVGATWVNNSTLPGWYAYQSSGSPILNSSSDDSWNLITRYARSSGQVAQGSLYNFGSSTSSSNRALGSYSQDRDFVYALVLQNDSSTTFDSFTLSYQGEQWQVNRSSNHASLKLDFSYGVFSSFNSGSSNPNTIVPNSSGNSAAFYNGYTNPANDRLDFSALVFGSSTLALNGDDSSNRTLLSSTESTNWAPGDYLVLRWFDDYHAGQIQSVLAIDDLQFTAVPEPSALGLMAIAALCGFGIWMRRKNAAGIAAKR